MELRCLTIVADDPGLLSEFYQRVFNLEPVRNEDATICLSDGRFSLALLPRQAGQAQGLHSIGFQRAEIQALGERMQPYLTGRALERKGAEGDWEFRDPDGNVLAARAGAFGLSERPGPAPIRHVALYTADPARLAGFYCTVFGMKEIDRTDRSSIFVSDGYFNVALLYQRKEEKPGFNHFGFHVKNNEEMRIRVEKAGSDRGARRPDRIPFAEFRVHDPEGNGIDISEKGWKA